LEINLEKVNRIDFEALNEGFAAPNTAELHDDKGRVIASSQWNIGTYTGYKTIIVDMQ
jgi:hypothetical protein